MSREGWRTGFIARAAVSQELRAVDEMRGRWERYRCAVGGADAASRPCGLDNYSVVGPTFSRIVFFVGIFVKSRIALFTGRKEYELRRKQSSNWVSKYLKVLKVISCAQSVSGASLFCNLEMIFMWMLCSLNPFLPTDKYWTICIFFPDTSRST
jgi:hypothetical protein